MKKATLIAVVLFACVMFFVAGANAPPFIAAAIDFSTPATEEPTEALDTTAANAVDLIADANAASDSPSADAPPCYPGLDNSLPDAFLVRVETFKTKASAEGLVLKLAMAELDAAAYQCLDTAGDGRWAVAAGPFKAESDAQREANRLAATPIDIQPIVIPAPAKKSA